LRLSRFPGTAPEERCSEPFHCDARRCLFNGEKNQFICFSILHPRIR
jgi:hypothetical protein